MNNNINGNIFFMLSYNKIDCNIMIYSQCNKYHFRRLFIITNNSILLLYIIVMITSRFKKVRLGLDVLKIIKYTIPWLILWDSPNASLPRSPTLSFISSSEKNKFFLVLLVICFTPQFCLCYVVYHYLGLYCGLCVPGGLVLDSSGTELNRWS